MIPLFLLHIQRHNPHYALNVDSTDQILQQTCVVPTNFHSNKSTHYFKNTYQDQTELKLITLHHITIHFEMMAIRAVTTENLNQQRKQVRIIERKLQLNMTKMARAVLPIMDGSNTNTSKVR